MKLLFISFLLLAAPKNADPCANKGTDLVFPKGNKLQIMKYDAATDTFEIQAFDFPGEGKSFVVREILAESLNGKPGDARYVRESPEDAVESVYTSGKDIPTLFKRERDARVKCRKPGTGKAH